MLHPSGPSLYCREPSSLTTTSSYRSTSQWMEEWVCISKTNCDSVMRHVDIEVDSRRSTPVRWYSSVKRTTDVQWMREDMYRSYFQSIVLLHNGDRLVVEVELCIENRTRGRTIRDQKDGEVFLLELGQRWNIFGDQCCRMWVRQFFRRAKTHHILGRNLRRERERAFTASDHGRLVFVLPLMTIPCREMGLSHQNSRWKIDCRRIVRTWSNHGENYPSFDSMTEQTQSSHKPTLRFIGTYWVIFANDYNIIVVLGYNSKLKIRYRSSQVFFNSPLGRRDDLFLRFGIGLFFDWALCLTHSLQVYAKFVQ